MKLESRQGPPAAALITSQFWSGGYVPVGTTVIRTPWETRAGHVRRKSETIEGLQRLGRRRKPIDDRLRDSSAATALRGQSNSVCPLLRGMRPSGAAPAYWPI